MATAKKLPSGSWRCLVFSHYEEVAQSDGTIKKKRVYKSFTCADPSAKGKRKCEKEAADWAAEKEIRSRSESMTFSQALQSYIAARENILSPRTIMDYKSIMRNYVQSIMDIPLEDIKQEDIQNAINIEAGRLAPKTIRNIHGLISAVFKTYRPNFALNTTLPQKRKTKLYIPTDAEVKRLLQVISGTEMELPVLLSAFGPMRRGEICALDMSDISGTVVHVYKNMVRTEDNRWIIKVPKSYEGDRYIDYPAFVADKWAGRSGRLVNLTPNNITDRFKYCLKAAGLPHFRFHDLRHYSASIQHALGIPDSYIMLRGGWGDDRTLKSVYRHALSDKAREMNDIANEHFSELCNTEYNTKK